MLNKINKHLSELKRNSDNIWWNQNHLSIEQNIESLYNFFNLLVQNNKPLKDILNVNNSTYSSSIIHYLLYYCSQPCPSFLTAVNRTLFFGLIVGKKTKVIHLCCPSYESSEALFLDMMHLFQSDLFSTIIKSYDISSIVLRDVNDQMVNYVRKNKKQYPFQIESLKQIPFAIYDIKKTLSMKGSRFSNIRWHLNKFEKANHTVSIITGKNLEKTLIHLIGKWRRQAIHKRGFSFVEVYSDTYGAKIIDSIENKPYDNHEKNAISLIRDNIFYRILAIDQHVRSFHLGYKIGFFNETDVCAHAIGITDISIPHLSEYAQIDFWKYIADRGMRYVNDGPSWRRSLEVFKHKFRPIHKQNYFWMTISLDKSDSDTIKNNQNKDSSHPTCSNINKNKFC